MLLHKIHNRSYLVNELLKKGIKFSLLFTIEIKTHDLTLLVFNSNVYCAAFGIEKTSHCFQENPLLFGFLQRKKIIFKLNEHALKRYFLSVFEIGATPETCIIFHWMVTFKYSKRLLNQSYIQSQKQ